MMPVAVCPANPHYLEFKGAHFVVNKGDWRGESVSFVSVPAGAYGLEWIDPATGEVVKSEFCIHPGGKLTVTAPGYSVDMALRMRSRRRKLPDRLGPGLRQRVPV
jgi:hypothetical protein